MNTTHSEKYLDALHVINHSDQYDYRDVARAHSYVQAYRNGFQQAKESQRELINALLDVCRAYQGVGDFEGTGEGMAEVMPIVWEALDKAGVKWGGAVTD